MKARPGLHICTLAPFHWKNKTGSFPRKNMSSLTGCFILISWAAVLYADAHFEQCNPKPLITRHEGKKPCVYLDTKGIKTIGVGYNMRNGDARAVFQSIGADYDKFNNGPVTKWNVPCNCSTVPCLTDSQINELLDITLKTAISDARKVIPNFDSLCCPVQNVMVDMSFTLGGPGFASFTTFSKFVADQFWKAAGDDLTVSKWCVQQATARCNEDANTVRLGCGCSGLAPQACHSDQGTNCCGDVSQQTCCDGTLTFKGKVFDEPLCCPFPKANCCEHNKCCQQPYPVCCPSPPAVPTYCCPADHPVCKDGTCYNARGNHVTNGKPAASSLPELSNADVIRA